MKKYIASFQTTNIGPFQTVLNDDGTVNFSAEVLVNSRNDDPVSVSLQSIPITSEVDYNTAVMNAILARLQEFQPDAIMDEILFIGILASAPVLQL